MATQEDPAFDGVVVYEAPRKSAAPVVFDVPHAGRVYPEDFRAAAPLHVLQSGEDRFVDQLVADAPLCGAHLVIARFARTYIDPNRRETDVDESLLSEPWPVPVQTSQHASLGAGLVFRLIGEDAVPIYDRLLSRAEVEHRIDAYHRPYHARLRRTLDAVRQAHGSVFHVSAHSMNSVGNALAPDRGRARADFVLGDRDGTACEPEFTGVAERLLRDLGYTVARNDPYKGAELVVRYGKPALQRHSLQIEIKRGLYMNEQSLEKHRGFEELRQNLNRFTHALCDWAAERATSLSMLQPRA